MEPRKRAQWVDIGGFVLVAVAAFVAYYFLGGKGHWPFRRQSPEKLLPLSSGSEGPPTVELTGKQLELVKVGRVEMRAFRIVKTAVGAVDFDQDRSTPVSSPYQGRILEVFVNLGDRVKSGDPLFAIESPDLMTAEATLIQTAGVLDLADANLVRLRGAAKLGGTAQKDLDQAVSDQKTAEGNYRAARLALGVFGKTDDEIDAIVKSRKVDRALVVRSPADGVVSARNAAPGLFVQPGNTPLTVSDDSAMWLNAFVVEADAPAIAVGDAVVARVPSASDTAFNAIVARVALSVDPVTHRQLVRMNVDNKARKLRAGMMATFEITVARPALSPSLPTGGVVREGDGSMTAWVRQDQTHFAQRVVKVGIEQDGRDQILAGLKVGEPVIVDGAVFVDNKLNAGPSD
ncbi:efflux RND transporter periplasmic adaptor subunit [Rhodoblastus sp.]|uniref:efflux RND transporter periplasmic adaptor subunit n=1 Tax=Rhodoblastus sp. TaxID=1962975 RepID=UPI0026296384|nr:efflux RND transporter periplasmic adaptor subunit [Rhodoblastus sp.]